MMKKEFSFSKASKGFGNLNLSGSSTQITKNAPQSAPISIPNQSGTIQAKTMNLCGLEFDPKNMSPRTQKFLSDKGVVIGNQGQISGNFSLNSSDVDQFLQQTGKTKSAPNNSQFTTQYNSKCESSSKQSGGTSESKISYEQSTITVPKGMENDPKTKEFVDFMKSLKL
jgi:hypothetical protein